MRNQDGISGLFFGSLPNLEELIAAKATIQTNKDDEIGTIQPMCCRELIFTEPKVLVSPLLEERNQLFLIIPSTEPVNLTKSLFQFCFSFTMKQKLAPLWNKAGEYLVQGRDFMQENSKLNAITLEVTISDKICIGLQACSLKSTPCKPEHFTASTRALEEFNTNSEALISDAAISDDLCFVLPSLKKGRIFSITHQLPEGCPFESYEELRKHWKLMIPSELYSQQSGVSVPSLRSSVDIQLVSKRPIMPHASCMWGTPALTSSPLYPTSRLQQATHANHSNLTRAAPPQFSHCRPFAIQAQHKQDSARSSPSTSSASQLISSQASSQIQPQREDNNAINQLGTTPTGTPFSYLSSTPFVPRFTSSKRAASSDDSDQTVSHNLGRPSTSGARIVPMFSRKRVQSHVKEPAGNNNSGHKTALTRVATPWATTKTVSRMPLVRHTVQTPSALSSASSLTSFQVEGRERMENAFERNNIHLGHTLPETRSCQTHESNMMGRGINGVAIQGIGENPSSNLNRVSTIESMDKDSPVIPSARSSSPHSTQVSKCLPQTRPGLVITQAPIRGHLSAASLTGNLTQGSAVGYTARVNMEQRRITDGNYSSLSDTPANRPPMSIAGPRGYLQEGNSPGQLYKPFSGLIQSSSNLARKRQVNGFPNEDTPHKKPKSKPRIQENIDVRELAIQDQLHKVNSVTLTDWLKKRGVTVKSKDKKAELASKVKQYLALVLHEH
ncbi:hypothetical protein OS493_030306 [Desmophyllum pertusum]|uniref:DUF4708 domain-containing protein n=1 Tax=Desmophyllum pertusum TaxID=174260 RepID=A0A9W9ZNE3_9CNID|nr:hypothetical protein OS493_030306 [Desmophyllum pertusum]